jgi:hypothetical protein
MIPKDFVKYQDRLYWTYRKVNQGQVIEERIQDLKEFWHCDIVLKQKTPQSEVFLFLREITDVEVIY